MERRFKDRTDAGRILAERLSKLSGRSDLIVLALPRGGVPVGVEIARALGAPLDVFVVRKLGVPGHEELAMGAIATGGVRVLNDDVVQGLGIDGDTIERVAQSELRELKRREEAYRGDRGAVDPEGRAVILVDDGLATGSTMRAAIAAVKQRGPKEVTVAVPVGDASVCDRIGAEVDEIVCASTPRPMSAISLWYDRFDQTTDEEVRELLERDWTG